MSAEVGLARFGDFQLIRELGRGASATVYLAHPIGNAERLCLKIFHPKLFRESDSIKRVNREFAVWAGLHHPNIVRIRSILHTEPPAIVMDYIEGDNLETFHSRLPYTLPEVSVLIVIEILKALEYSHEKGVIHRDLKPENVVIEKSGRVFVSDFGLAKFEDATSNITQPQGIVGSADYMSPEQTSGETITVKSDLFSVGSILFFLTTGTRPFSRPTSIATLQAIQHESFEAPERRNPKISGELSRIIQQALHKDPTKRFPTATEFRAALETYVKEIGLGPGAFSFVRWVAEPTQTTLSALRTATENLSQSAERAANEKNWPKALETLAHLSLKGPESPTINRITDRMRSARRPAKWWASAALVTAILLTFVGVQKCGFNQKELNAPEALAAIPAPAIKEVEVRFNVAKDVQVIWDGVRVDPTKPVPTVPGKHKLQLKKTGFNAIEQDVDVTTTKPVVINAQ